MRSRRRSSRRRRSKGTTKKRAAQMTYLASSVLFLDGEHCKVAALHPAVVVELADHGPEGVARGAVEGQVAEVGPVVNEVPIREYRVGLAQLLVDEVHHELEIVLPLVLVHAGQPLP